MNRSPDRISGQRRQARKREEPDNQRRMEEVEGEDDEEEDDISQSLTVLHLKDAQPQVVASDRGNDTGALSGAGFRSFRRNLVCEQISPFIQEEVGESALAESLQDLGDHEERAPLQKQDTQILPLPQEEVGEGAHAESRQYLWDHNQNLPFPQEEVGESAQEEVGESAHDLEGCEAGAPLQARPQEDDPIISVHNLSDHEFDDFLQEPEEKKSISDLEIELLTLSEAYIFAIPVPSESEMMRIRDQLSNPEACVSCHREEMEVVVLPCCHKYACKDCFHQYFVKVLPFKCFICHSKCTVHNFL